MMKTASNILLSAILIAGLLLTAGCVEVGIPADGNKKWGELNPIADMHSFPSFKWQEDQWRSNGMRLPPPKAQPVNHREATAMKKPEQAGKKLHNPVPITERSVNYGKKAYETTCITCHGPKGKGNGYVVGQGKYPRPPSLVNGRSVGWPDGRIFHVISNGQARMWSYKSQLYPVERWAVVNYVRVLQRAQHPHPRDRRLE
jgi:cytochrome c553